MSEQRHVIKRQLIELQVQGSDGAWQLQQEISRVYRQRIIPLIDRCCTELSAPDRLHRIESLELDLGTIDPGRLESDLMAKVEAALRPALAQQIGALEEDGRTRPDQQPQVRSQMELFALFARTGNLPWWAEASRPHLLEESLQGLISAAPDSLRRLIKELVQERRPLQRIITQFDDTHLSQLAALLAPVWRENLAQEIPTWVKVLGMTIAGGKRSPAQLRRIIWEQIILVAAQQGARQATTANIYRELLPRLALQMDTDYSLLVADIRQQLSQDEGAIPLALAQQIGPLEQDGRGRPDQQPQVRSQLELFAVFARTGSLPGWAEASRPHLLEESLQSLIETAPDSLRRLMMELVQERRPLQRIVSHYDDAHLALLAALLAPAWQEYLAQDSSPWIPALDKIRIGGRRYPAQLRRIIWEQLLIVAARQGVQQATAATFYRELLRLLSLEPAALETVPIGLSTTDLASMQQALGEFFTEQIITPIIPDEPALDLSFSDGDALYVGNAGLLILWPFLDHFFGRLGLLRKSQFLDNEARQRAIGLLQYLATGVPDFPEYQLPLNKVLCGLEPDALFDFGLPLTDEEMEEGNDLLRAVVAQAPILRDMSVDGLRGTFLLRQGALRTRDGAWLLQVDRETHDIVLDRFPWSWAWVKLPWMQAPLQVEW